MHIFRHSRQATTVGALWAGCRAALRAGTALEGLLRAAQLECACADRETRQTPEALTPARAAWLRLAESAAAYYLELGPRPGPEDLAAAATALPPAAAEVTLGAWEGVRYYALWPAGYAEAARDWLRERAAARAGDTVWVLGLRSIGSLLAPIVAAALRQAGCRVRAATLRPMGAPGQREFRPAPELGAAWSQAGGDFLVVDEGPGLSGSSFGGCVQCLRRLGVPAERIALLPAWSPVGDGCARLHNAYAARHWAEWRVFPAAPLAPPREESAVEISGGAWRDRLGSFGEVPVWPQHERRKFLCRRGTVIAKFGGLGEWGRATRARARELARRGWGPALADGNGGGEEGWICYHRVRCAPLRNPGAQWCEFTGRYLAGRAAAFRSGAAAAPSPELREMVRRNLERLLGRAAPREAPEGAITAVDGHMMAWEWGETASGYVKFDGTDHADDPFFPGPADIAWDLATVDAEFGRARGDAVRAAFCRASGETEAALRPRLRWHRIAYAAFRAAYCAFAATETEAADRAGFERQARRYRTRLARLTSVYADRPH